MPPTNPPKTDAERQAKRRQRRKEEFANMRAALLRIAHACPDAETRELAINTLLENDD
jgi:hypothetical protein